MQIINVYENWDLHEPKKVYNFSKIEGCEEFGRYFSNDSSIDKRSILEKVYFVERAGMVKNRFLLFKWTPGLLDNYNKFYPCPLSIFYIQILGVSTKHVEKDVRHSYNDYIYNEMQIVLYSKDFSESRKMELISDTTISNSGSGRSIGVYPFNWQINLLNECILRGYRLDDIGVIKFRSTIGFTRIMISTIDNHRELVVKIVKDLLIEYGFNDQIKASNEYSISAKFNNLPTDKYLINLINKALWNLDNVQLHLKDELVFKFKRVTSFEFSISTNSTSEILNSVLKDILSMELFALYDKEDHMCSCILKD